MKINRFFAMAALAVLVVGAIGVFGARAYADAQESTIPGQATEAPDGETVDAQAGNQAGSVGQDAQSREAEDSNETNPSSEVSATEQPDQQGEQSPAYTGSITVDPATTQGLSETDEAAALAKLAKLTTDQAKAAALAANAGATVVKTKLGVENGSLVYGVELSTGVEVKIDAGNGAILATETDDGH